MPYLKKSNYRRPKENNNKEVYNKQRWRKLRKLYFMEHPLCEFCLKLGKVTPAEDIHHKNSPFNYEGNHKFAVAFDYDNLISLCKVHHQFLHRNGRTNGLNLNKEVEEWKKRH